MRRIFLLVAMLFIATAGMANTIESGTLTDDGGGVFTAGEPVQNVTQGTGFDTIQAAIDAADSGDVINIDAGTYVERPSVTKSLTFVGADQATVIIDAGSAASSSYGFTVTADDVSISNLTLVGNPNSSSARYGFKISGDVTNFTMNNVTAREFYRTGVDLLGVTNGVLTDVTSQDNNGHGLSLCDCNGITLTNTTLVGNAWQNVSIATWGHYSALGTSGIVFDGVNTFGELFQLEMGDYNNPGVAPSGEAIITYSTSLADGADVTVLASDFEYAIHGQQDDFPGQVRIWFMSSFANASTLLAAAPIGHWSGVDMYIESLTDGTQLYVTPGGTIQAAIDVADSGDTINVAEGTFYEILTVNKSVSITGAGQATYDGSGSWTGGTLVTRDPNVGGQATNQVVHVTADDVSLSDLTIDGRYGFDQVTGQTTNYGIMVAAAGVTLTNVDVLDSTNHAIELNNADYATLTNVLVKRTAFAPGYYNPFDCGLRCVDSENLDVDGFVADGTKRGIVVFQGFNSGTLEDITIQGSSVADSYGVGLYTSPAPGWWQPAFGNYEGDLTITFEGVNQVAGVDNGIYISDELMTNDITLTIDPAATFDYFGATSNGALRVGSGSVPNLDTVMASMGLTDKTVGPPDLYNYDQCWGYANIREHPYYSPSTDLVLGDFDTFWEGVEGYHITSDFQINIEYQDGINCYDVDNFNAYAPGGEWTYNFSDEEQYAFNYSATGGLTIYEYDNLAETVGGSDIKWTITGWHQTILAGDVINGKLVVLPSGTYRPFTGDVPVNDVEIFDGDLDCEVLGYTFDFSNGVVGGILGVEKVGDAIIAISPEASGPINCSESSLLIVDIDLSEAASALRGYEVTVSAGAEVSFDASDIIDLGALSSVGAQSFHAVDNGDGTVTVSAALLGDTPGLTAAADLFSINTHGASTGEATISLTAVLRDLTNGDISFTTSDANVSVDCTASDVPTMVAEPVFTAGTSNTVSWSDESGSGAELYYAECSSVSDFSAGLVNSGWIADLSYQFTDLTGGVEYYYHVKSKDTYDNESAYSDAVFSTQDSALPVSEVDPLVSYHNTMAFDVAYTASDLLVGSPTRSLASIKLFYQVDGGSWIQFGDTFTSSPIAFTATFEGCYGFYTIATDDAGQVELAPDPLVADASTIVDTIDPVGTFVINNDDAITNSVDVTLYNAITDDNAPLEMQFSNDNTTFSSWVAYDATASFALTVGDGVKTVYARFKDSAENIFEIDDSITLDGASTAAPTALAVVPGNQKIDVSWVDPVDPDLTEVEIWRGVWHDGSGVSVYPEYDDDAGSTTPTRPADRAAALSSTEWELAGTVDAGIEAFSDDNLTARGICYYELFAIDSATNYSAPVADSARATNYWLGDVADPYDGLVNTADITTLGSAFGAVDGDDYYNNEDDVGPTGDMSRVGIPTTDNTIDFEDLMVFAMNYGVVGSRELGNPGALSMAILAWNCVEPGVWTLELIEPCESLQGLKISAPEQVVQVSVGQLIREQNMPYFLSNINQNGLDASVALMGTDQVIIGSGELIKVTVANEEDLTNILISV
ncbi:hypothetical protein HN388_01600, partial [bacterium]|nr:hypothetical protein [bacterium]